MIIEKKLPHLAQNVTGFETSQFTIEADSHIFQMFSSGVYTDVVKAIIRELSTNAVDAHLEAGTSDLPFDIHLPNITEPYFSIRDYGTGLSISQIKGIYSTYLKSTKTGTNEAIGGLGIGSKSPFAYTDNFTITSYHNGHIYIFSTFKDDNGIPSLAQIHEGVSDQPNGLEIQFSVEKKDFTDFQEKAKEVFFWFNSPVNFLNGFQLKTWKDYPHYETDDFIVFRRQSVSRYSPVRVSILMGQISYPITAGSNSLSQFHDSESHSLMSKFRDNNWEFVVKAPIGSVNFVPSREHLKSTKNTNDFLIDVFSAANVEKNLGQIRKKIEDEFLKVGRWEIANFFSKSIPDAIFNFDKGQWQYENKAKFQKELLEKYKTSVDPKLPFSYDDHSGLHLKFGTLDIPGLEIKTVRSYSKIRTETSKSYEVTSATDMSSLHFFYQTKKANPAAAKMVNLLSSAGDKSNTVVFLDHTLPLEDQKQKIADFLDAEIDDLLVYTEDDFKKSSPSKPQKERVPLFYVMRQTGGGYRNRKWIAHSITKEGVQRYSRKIAYVKIKNRTVLGDLSNYTMSALAKTVEAMNDNLGFNVKLIFATEFSAAHMDPLWVDLKTVLNDFWVPLCEKLEKESHIYTPSYKKLQNIQSDLRLFGDPLFTFGLDCVTSDPDVSNLMSFMSYSSDMKEASTILDKICFGDNFVEKVLKQSTSKCDEIFEKYPLLNVIDKVTSEPAAKDLIEYIKQKGNKQ